MRKKRLTRNDQKFLIETDNSFDPKGSDDGLSNPQISNNILNKKQNKKICMTNLRERLRKKEVKERHENRILYSLFFSIVAVLFYIAT